jgi:glutamate racemase
MAAKGGAVGFFDSGLGGLCILDAFKTLCPHESTVYIADSKNCPYGNKPADEIVRLAERHTRRLLKRGCKMIVVACNTATAAAIDFLRERHPEVPFIGIEPAVKPAALRSKTGVVGVLATAGTFGGRLYNETKAKFAKDVTVIATVADEFVELVERNEISGAAAERVVRARIEPLLKAGCDKIVLGCTHFPHLKPLIEKICEGRAEVIDPSDAVARQARRVLSARGLAAPASAKPSRIFIRT